MPDDVEQKEVVTVNSMTTSWYVAITTQYLMSRAKKTVIVVNRMILEGLLLNHDCQWKNPRYAPSGDCSRCAIDGNVRGMSVSSISFACSRVRQHTFESRILTRGIGSAHKEYGQFLRAHDSSAFDPGVSPNATRSTHKSAKKTRINIDNILLSRKFQVNLFWKKNLKTQNRSW